MPAWKCSLIQQTTWPDSSPAAVPLENRGRALWFSNGVLPRRYAQFAPEWVVKFLIAVKRTIRSQYPTLLRTVLIKRLKRQNRTEEAESVAIFARSLERADLILICGAGGFYDGCQGWNMDILDLSRPPVRETFPQSCWVRVSDLLPIH